MVETKVCSINNHEVNLETIRICKARSAPLNEWFEGSNFHHNSFTGQGRNIYAAE
jgi:hypothetical protein